MGLQSWQDASVMTVSLRCPARAVVVALLPLGLLLSGCASQEKLAPPVEHRSPLSGERTWAVVPFANESGVSAVDTLGISDDFVAEVEAVEGLRCIPLNRSITGLRSLGLAQIRSDAEARALLRVLQVDGLVVGSITAYDPYKPMTLGIAAQVYTVDSAAPTATDVGELTLAVTERGTADRARLAPAAQASRVYDARNHDVLERVGRYAAGRHDPKSGMRESVYVHSMDAYSRFVAFEVVGSLVGGLTPPESIAAEGDTRR
jgi:hypothetical protein